MNDSLRWVALCAVAVCGSGLAAASCTLDTEGMAVDFPPGYEPDAGEDTSAGGTAGAGGTGAFGGSGGSSGVGGGGAAGVGGGGGSGGAAGSGGDGGAAGTGGDGGAAGSGGDGGGAGTGGDGGAAGSGGIAGSGGDGGGAGSGGDGGAAGSGGLAGSGGDGGAAGSGGDGGAAGSGGDGGAAGSGGGAGSGGDGGAAGGGGLAGGGGDGGTAGSGAMGGSAGNGGASGGGGDGGTAGSGGDGGAGGDAGSGGSAGQGGSGGSPVGESCVDKTDNDLDGKVDCADGDCSAYACVDAIPAGWDGYFYLHTWSFDGAAPAPIPCADGSTPERFYQGPSSAEDCTCTCGAMSGATCGPAPIECATGSSSCNSADDWTSALAGGTCQKPGNGAVLSCRLTGPAPVTKLGVCTPTSKSNNLAPFAFIQDACKSAAPFGGGCGSRVCALGPTLDYPAPVCIRKFGSDSCPPGWPNAAPMYRSYDDQRACTSCACTPQAGTVACPGTQYTAYDANNCTGGADVVDTLSCNNLTDLADGFTWSLRLTQNPTPTGGSCSASGGIGSGFVEPLDPATFCCK